MHRIATWFGIVVLVAVSTACARVSSTPPDTITMGSSDFVGPLSLTVAAGTTVNFVDPAATGGTHILVTGTNGQYATMAGAPAALNTAAGVTFAAGVTKQFVFMTAGTYPITCTIHPTMQVTITVT